MKPLTQQPDPDYCRVTHVKNDGAPWSVSYPTERSGKVRRIRKSFSSEDRARQFAAEMDLAIAERGIRLGSLPPEVRRAYQVYLDASSELAKMEMDLPDFESLVRNGIDALRHQTEVQKFIVAEAIEQFLDQKAAHLKTVVLRSLQHRLRLFAQSFGDRPIQSIHAEEIRIWLTELPRQRKPKERSLSPSGLSALSVNHYRSALSALFGHAERQDWIAKNPITGVPREFVAHSDVSAPPPLSPSKAALIMHTALHYSPEIVPALALSMYAGLRISEAARTDLSGLFTQSALESKQFVQSHGRSKTGNRCIPVSNPLRGWLDAQPRQAGSAWEGTQRELLAKISEALTMSGADPIIDSPRYTYIRYRLEQTRDVFRVMIECGVTLGLIRTLSLQPASIEDTEQFFSILPKPPQ